MEIHLFKRKSDMGKAAAVLAAQMLNEMIYGTGEANIVLATGASQFEMLNSLLAEDVDWSWVSSFNLDEYIGLPVSHPASFRNYLKKRFVDKVPNLRAFHAVD